MPNLELQIEDEACLKKAASLSGDFDVAKLGLPAAGPHSGACGAKSPVSASMMLRRMLGGAKAALAGHRSKKQNRSTKPVGMPQAVNPPTKVWKQISQAAVSLTTSGSRRTALDNELIDTFDYVDDCTSSQASTCYSRSHSLCSSDVSLSAPDFLESGDAYLCWDRALNGRQAMDVPSEELRELVRQHGVPLKHRLQLWPKWFDTNETMLTVSQSLPDAIVNSIDMDIQRTKPRMLDDSTRTSLRQVLLGFAAAHPEVGYCQGLNNIAATFLLLGFEEADAQRGLAALVKRCCPCYHGPRLEGYRADVVVLEALAKDILSQEALACLDNLGVPLTVLAVEHFLSLSSSSWPLAATARFWDLLFLDGQPALFASFLALLQLYLPEAQSPCLPDRIDDDVDPVNAFRQAVMRGLTEDLETVIGRTRSLIPAVNQQTLDQKRRLNRV
jgi:hypothetical protein